jgi:hypothetical protein
MREGERQMGLGKIEIAVYNKIIQFSREKVLGFTRFLGKDK